MCLFLYFPKEKGLPLLTPLSPKRKSCSFLFANRGEPRLILSYSFWRTRHFCLVFSPKFYQRSRREGGWIRFEGGLWFDWGVLTSFIVYIFFLD
ncbi:hypothetical protein CQA58_04400 [Helicobacter brantae]|uniref:Uncharacterized protein n=1 Tax=Helicobacter brantae TaxID=375927 RepID=A0A3D8IZR9_9HELI|nr:hypothetical protein CQA58_04400 [Helicobacter brantae]